MTFDNIIANPPYSQLGVNIVNKIMHDVPHNDISILGTRAMLSKHNGHLALEYVYIEDYILEPPTKHKWVQQLILLGHKGSCQVIPKSAYNGHSVEQKPNELRVPFGATGVGLFNGATHTLLTRNRNTSFILSVSDEDYEYVKKHWDGMNRIERFWWMYDRGLYKRFIEEKTDFQSFSQITTNFINT